VSNIAISMLLIYLPDGSHIYGVRGGDWEVWGDMVGIGALPIHLFRHFCRRTVTYRSFTTVYSITDRQTDARIMPIANHVQYDQLKIDKTCKIDHKCKKNKNNAITTNATSYFYLTCQFFHS